jgi:hypothetical protein
VVVQSIALPATLNGAFAIVAAVLTQPVVASAKGIRRTQETGAIRIYG